MACLGSFLCQVMCCAQSPSPPPLFFCPIVLGIVVVCNAKGQPKEWDGGRTPLHLCRGGWGDEGAGKRCKCIAAPPLHTQPAIVPTRLLDQEGAHVCIVLSQPVDGPCWSTGHGGDGVVQCSMGRHCHLVRIVPPPLAWTHNFFVKIPMDYLKW